jgi:flavin-dependent dehydrogenase
MYGDGYLLVGDAFAFIDPVFSTGVYFAMNGAALGTDAVDAYLRDPGTSAEHFKRFDRQVRRGIKTVSWFIYRFTSPALQQLFMAPRNMFRIEQAIISMLAGDIFRDPMRLKLPLTVFKGIYGLTQAANFSRAWTSYRRRKRNVGVSFTGGTTSQDPC